MIKGDLRRFSWRWAAFDVAFLIFAWVMVWLHQWPRLALVIFAVLVAFVLLVEISRYYHRGRDGDDR